MALLVKRIASVFKQHTARTCKRIDVLVSEVVSQPSTESYSTFRTTELYEGGPNLLNGGGVVLWNRNMYLHGKLCSSQWDSSGLNLELGGLQRLLSDQQEVFLISSCRQMALRADCTRQALDISVARAFAVTPLVHLTVSVPLYCTRLTMVFIVLLVASDSPNMFGPMSLDSGHQSKSEICKQRTDRTSVLTVPLRRRVVPS